MILYHGTNTKFKLNKIYSIKENKNIIFLDKMFDKYFKKQNINRTKALFCTQYIEIAESYGKYIYLIEYNKDNIFYIKGVNDLHLHIIDIFINNIILYPENYSNLKDNVYNKLLDCGRDLDILNIHLQKHTATRQYVLDTYISKLDISKEFNNIKNEEIIINNNFKPIGKIH